MSKYQQLPYCVCVNSNGSDETAQMFWPIENFAACHSNKYQYFKSDQLTFI